MESERKGENVSDDWRDGVGANVLLNQQKKKSIIHNYTKRHKS